MTDEQLNEGKKLKQRLIEVKDELEHIGYLSSDNILPRTTYLKYVFGQQGRDTITVPKRLMKKVVALLEFEYREELGELEKQFEKL